MDDDAETACEKAAELTQNAQSTAAPACSVPNGTSIQGQAAAAVLAAERETRAPVTHQERRRRSEVSEEEFERRQALVKHQSFWSWLQHTGMWCGKFNSTSGQPSNVLVCVTQRKVNTK